MGHKKREDIQERDLQGFKFFKRIRALLEPLHMAACERDRRAERMLADLAIGDRLVRKADGGRRPNAIREIPAYV